MHRYIERAREEAGFTLIELLIVIVILGILAGVVVFSVGGITDRGNVAACKTDLSTVTVHVTRLRSKLGDHHRVQTVWGRGYLWSGHAGQ